MSIVESLVAIQRDLKSPKDQRSDRYRYRNIEDINEAVKPLAAEHGCAVLYTDEVRTIEGRLYLQATCRLTDGEGELYAQGVALMTTNPKNMSIEQASGAASSYARKYAAQGLFAIDSSENDPDRNPPQQLRPKFVLAEACRRKAERFGEDAEEVMQEEANRDDMPAGGEALDRWYLERAKALDAMQPKEDGHDAA